MAIRFYGATGAYGFLSNFAPYPIYDEFDRRWKTVEHYFQAHKFEEGTEAWLSCRNAASPGQAKRLGREGHPLRDDWEEVKELVMLKALRLKFTNTKVLRDPLLATGTTELIEAAPRDFYWGCGRDGTGKNRLGVLLMQVRSELREAL
jgi:hypothetical protein